MPKSHCPELSGRFEWPLATPQIMATGIYHPCTLAVNLPFMYLLNGAFFQCSFPASDLYFYNLSTLVTVWVWCCLFREAYITLTVCSAWCIAPWIFYEFMWLQNRYYIIRTDPPYWVARVAKRLAKYELVDSRRQWRWRFLSISRPWTARHSQDTSKSWICWVVFPTLT